MSNEFKIGDLVVCIDSFGTQLTYRKVYTVLESDQCKIKILNDIGIEVGYFNSRFELYEPAQKQENTMQQSTPEQHVKDFLKRLEHVLVNDGSIEGTITFVGNLLCLPTYVSDLYGVDDIYTYINNSYDQLTSQAAQKRKQELLDKKAKLDVELAEINKELEGL